MLFFYYQNMQIYFLFIVGIFGMFNGVQISHPIFSVLFTNLVVGLISTFLNIFGFIFLKFDRYIGYSNGCTGIFLSFHCSVWCITSILCYIYILHCDWINEKFADQRKLSVISVASVFILVAILVLPPVAFAPQFWLEQISIYF